MTAVINDRAIELIERFAHYILEDCKNQEELSVLKNVAPYITYFSNATELTKSREKVFDKYIDMIESASEEPNSEDVLNEFNKEISNIKMKLESRKSCPRYDDLMQLISSKDGEDGDEVETVRESLNTIDPISKKPIVEPVRNKKCRHVYEKTTILQLIEKNPRTKCPIPGCVVSNYVDKSDLVSDVAMKRALMMSQSGGNVEKKIKTV